MRANPRIAKVPLGIAVGLCLLGVLSWQHVSYAGTTGNLLANGSFETIATPQGYLWPWIWTKNYTVIYYPGHMAEGNACDVVTGEIHQDVSVVPGMTYQLRFAFGGNEPKQFNSGPLHVNWGAQTVTTIPVSQDFLIWRYQTFEVVASSSVMRLSFSTLSAEASPLVDDVSLVAVPEPSALAFVAMAGAGVLAASRQRKFARRL